MRFGGVCFFLALVLALAVAGAPARAASGVIAVRANGLAYYSDRFILEADGNVVVNMPDGRTVTGETMSIDLRNDRMLIAGNVHLRTAGHDWWGAAFSEFFDFKRGYFLPILSEPDRWTFLDGNFAEPQPGRVMPEDAFALPDLGGQHVYMYAKSARIMLQENVVFGPGRLFAGAGYAPVPSYVLNFSKNPNFAQNSLNGAQFDAPYNFAGGRRSLSTLHFRYDNVHKAFLAYEGHIVGEKNYATFSVNPINRPDKQYNLQVYNRLGKHAEQRTSFQLFTFQTGLSRPLSATSYFATQTNLELRHSSLQLSIAQFNQSLLAEPAPDVNGAQYYGDPSHYFDRNHPFNATLSWTGFEHKLWKLPLTYQLRSGYGWYYNQFGVQAFNGVNYPLVHQPYTGISAYIPTIKVARNYGFDLRADKQRSWYTSPHFIDSTSTTMSLSRSWGTHVAAAVFYSVQNVVDNYGGQQLIAYPPNTAYSNYDNQVHPGYAAFSGAATSRTLAEQFTFTPNPNFSFKMQFYENKDFPAPIPDTVGRAPAFARLEMRVRVSPSLLLDLGRSYYFNYGSQRWQPQFDLRLGP